MVLSDSGPAGPTDQHWAQVARQARSTALSDIRGAANKWAGTIASLTGVFTLIGFIKGPSDITTLVRWTEILVAIALLAAVLLAFAAILLAALAAQGIPVKTSAVNNPRAYKRLYEKQAAAAARQLEWSRYLAAGAVLALSLAVVGTWFGQQNTPPPTVLVVENSGAALCGPLAANAKTGMVSIQPDPTYTPIPVSHVTSITIVTACH